MSNIIVINQQYETNPQFQKTNSTHKLIKTQLKSHNQTNNSIESFSTILEQSLTTNDSPMLLQILLETNTKIIKNTLEQLSRSKISIFLGRLEYFIIKQTKNDNLIFWLSQLLKIHYVSIVNNQENREIVERLRKYINKRAQNYDKLSEIGQQVPYKAINKNSQSNEDNDKPKFIYTEQQITQKHTEFNEQVNKKLRQQDQINAEDIEAFEEYLQEQF